MSRSPSLEPAAPEAELPAEAWVVALSTLDGMGPARLRALLDAHPDPATAWQVVRTGRAAEAIGSAAGPGADPRTIAASWARAAASIVPSACWQRHVDAGIGVALVGSASFPSVFVDDPAPPTILFHRGDPDVVAGSRVAIVGTRDCTHYGFDMTFELARGLAEVGVAIVSGLALGIDSAAHAGALEVDGAPPIAVVGSGLDRIYPRRNGPLWRQVAKRGVIWSEYPLGTAATAWHFPARNRLLAALADVVVVVESHAKGGALLTAEEALARQRPVLAVPGPVRSSASAGTNDLLSERIVGVARDVTDVLVALHLEPGSHRRSAERRPPPAPDDVRFLDAMGWQPVTLDHLAQRTGASLAAVAEASTRLEAGGWIAERGGWYERRARPDG